MVITVVPLLIKKLVFGLQSLKQVRCKVRQRDDSLHNFGIWIQDKDPANAWCGQSFHNKPADAKTQQSAKQLMQIKDLFLM